MLEEIRKALIRKDLDHVTRLVKAKQGDYYDRIAKMLANLLLRNWDRSTREAIKAAIRMLKSGEGKIKKAEIDRMLRDLARRLGVNFAAKMDERLFTFIVEVYTHSQREILGVQPVFNLTDNRAIQWLQENHVYWIGRYYDTQLADKIRQLARQILDEGMDREAAGKHIQVNFREQFKKSTAYWEGLANHVTTRAREFGRTEAYVKAGIKYLKFVAVMDQRTSRICRALHGKVFPVAWAVRTRDKLIAARKPDDVKKIAPWISDEEVERKIEGKPVKKLPRHVAMPPLHFNCRSRTVAAGEGERPE